MEYERTKRRMPLSSCSSYSLMIGRGDRSLKWLFSLEAFWHFIFLDFLNGKLSDLSFEFEFLFYRRMVTKRRASAPKMLFCISQFSLFWLGYLFQHFQRITLRFGWKMQRTSKILSSDSLNGLRTSNRGLNLQSFLCGFSFRIFFRSVFFKTTTLDLLLT